MPRGVTATVVCTTPPAPRASASDDQVTITKCEIPN